MAAYNGANTVLSGPAQDLERAVAELSAESVRTEWLDTSHAFHSSLLDPILDEFESYANRFEFGPPQRTLVCNRTGAAVGWNTKLDGSYRRRHARQPVEFAKSVATLADMGCTMLLSPGLQELHARILRQEVPRPRVSTGAGDEDHYREVADALVAGVSCP